MHNAAFAALGLDWVYVPFEVAPEDLGAALAGVRALGMAGVNVTVPLKELVPPHLDSLTDRAAALQAVNTVVHRDGRLVGDSTDGPGFLAALAYAGFAVDPGTRAVVLGAGGSARAVVLALLDGGASVVVANRSEERALALAAQLSEAGAVGTLTLAPLNEAGVGAALRGAALLVNTTSLGMHPNDDEMPPVPAGALTPDLFVCDLIYNPAETRLLALARSRGCRTQNGAEMLVRQGALSFSQWTGVGEPPLGVMRQAVFSALGLPEERA
jgi:shikimate dehydrogenase